MPATPATTMSAKPVPLWRRFAAMLYDLFPLLGLWIVGAALWMLAFHRGDSLQQLAASTHDPLDRTLRDLWLLALAGAYFVVSWARVGATVGSRAWKFRVLRADGSRMGLRTAVLRCALAAVSLVLLGAGFWYAWFDAEHRTWHDRVCGTRVTRL